MKSRRVGACVGLYGNTKIIRGECLRCKREAFVLDGKLACCGRPYGDTPKRVIRMTLTEQVRRSPRKKARQELLKEYEWSCAYCERAFGSTVKYYGKDTKVTLHWDHKVPYKYNQNNHADNFLPVCRFCNLWKGARMFDTIEDVRVYMHGKWMEHDEQEESRWKSSVSQSLSENTSPDGSAPSVEQASPSQESGESSVPQSANGKNGRQIIQE